LVKSKRQNKIIELISGQDIETQDDLVRMLQHAGFQVTQATISRDIKELHLIKIQTDTGIYKYAVNEKKDTSDMNVLFRIFKDTVQSVESAGNIVVIRTLTGSANAAAEVVDGLHIPEVAGTIAGDNTIFVAIRSLDAAAAIVSRFRQMLKLQE
jgi:transcriptional regulator of arginine metabolism